MASQLTVFYEVIVDNYLLFHVSFSYRPSACLKKNFFQQHELVSIENFSS